MENKLTPKQSETAYFISGLIEGKLINGVEGLIAISQNWEALSWPRVLPYVKHYMAEYVCTCGEELPPKPGDFDEIVEDAHRQVDLEKVMRLSEELMEMRSNEQSGI